MKTLFTFVLACFYSYGFAQQDTILMSEAGFHNDGYIHLEHEDWLFNRKDTVKPPVPGQEWNTLKFTDFGSSNVPSAWNGKGWFAIWVKADAIIANRKLAIQINHDGASEIYVDGKPVGGYGKLGSGEKDQQFSRAPKSLIPFWPGDTLPHLIAVRYANFKAAYTDFVGFQMAVGDYDRVSKRIATSNHRMNFLLLTVGAYFILGLLFLFLYLFYPTQKLNLYYAVFVLVLGATTLNIYFFYETAIPHVQFMAENLTFICKTLLMWSGTMMLYAVGYTKMPRRRVTVISAISAIYIVLDLILLNYYGTYDWNDYFSWVFFLLMVDGFAAIYKGIQRKLPNVWLIAVGMAAISLVYVFAWGDVFGLWPQRLNSLRLLVTATGNLVFPACFSFYLALDFARTNQHLAHKLKEVEVLYAQNLQQEAEKLELVSGEARRLEATVKERTAELQQQADKLKEMDAVKSRFFTNITHEFKTPLTLILNPAQELLTKSASSFVQTNAGLIESNAQRLLQLINQLLDLSKLENDVMEIITEPVELVQEIRNQAALFRPLAIQKEIMLSIESDWSTLVVEIDKDKLIKIIHNLLSNAIKFSENGLVEIALTAPEDKLGNGFTLTIKDTGSGIPEDKLPFIFERFYQADRYDTRSHEGSGIGLALTRELVMLMGGTIDAESKPDAYTIITVQLPCAVLKAVSSRSLYLEELPKEKIALAEAQIADLVTDVARQWVLIIEDNASLRDFLASVIGADYNVLSAADGKSGVAMAREHVPDIIITDIMMPGADGYWVCDTLKSEETTSHIPIVFLTAKSDAESRVKGIKTGADAYLAKPFHQQELDAVLENLLAVRNLLQKKYSHSLSSSNADDELPSIEQTFINRVNAYISDHLDDQQFGAEQLAVLMTLSRSQLHRKLKGLLGKSAGELIRTARMEQAVHLLKNRTATIAEIAYMVGFSTPSAFATSFSRYYGYPPSEQQSSTELYQKTSG